MKGVLEDPVSMPTGVSLVKMTIREIDVILEISLVKLMGYFRRCGPR